MKRSTLVLLVVGVLVGLVGGFLWWGVPTGRLKTELQDVRASADRLSRELDDLQHKEQDLGAQLKTQKTRLEATERDLRLEREMNSRLHLIVSEGKK